MDLRVLQAFLTGVKLGHTGDDKSATVSCRIFSDGSGSIRYAYVGATEKELAQFHSVEELEKLVTGEDSASSN